jgi:glycosyltransferase involved in cell wall biosynthesis
MPIDIVLTTWKREDICRATIETLKKNTSYTPFRLIVIDNGSQESFQEWLLKTADIYVKMDKNYGLEHVKNIGMNFVESPMFISTDNDILVPKPDHEKKKDWLIELIELKQRHPTFASIALRPQTLVGTKYEDVFPEDVGEIVEFSHVPGYMRLMDSDVVRALGAWKDKRPLRGHEEIWISERIRDMGKKCGWAGHIPCWHIFGGDDWGYTGMKPEEHGHRPVSFIPKDDWDVIKEVFDYRNE